MKKIIYLIAALTLTSSAFAAEKWDWFAAMDKNEDGKVTEAEWIARAKANSKKQKKQFNEKAVKTYFNNADADKNGTVSRKELDAATAKNKKNKKKK